MRKQRGYISEGAYLALLTGVIGVLFLGTLGVAFWANHATCHNRAGLMRLQADWGLLQGCMVRVDDRWAPIEYIRIVNGQISIAGDGA